MNISLLRSDVIYRKMINVPKEKREVDETQQKQIQLISEDCLWNECKKTIEKDKYICKTFSYSKSTYC